MRIDDSHRRWAFASAAILVLSAVAYVPYALTYPGGPRGNSLPGLIYGAAGYGMMLFAGLMGARKKVPLWRIGRAKVWMRGHLWMGALSLFMIFFHSGFTARGPLTVVLMTLLVITWLSGIVGAIVQHLTPRILTSNVPMETIYEEIPHVREQLREEADRIIGDLCNEPDRVLANAAADTGRIATAEEEEAPVLDADERYRLREVYTTGILPFLRDPENPDSPLAWPARSGPYFDALRRQSPLEIHQSLTDIENICEEQRQLTRQSRMYIWLHGWLLVHVPLAITLIVLAAVHALSAIRF